MLTLKDYKEALSKVDVFTHLIRLVISGLDQEDQECFKDALLLIRNLVSVPDPGPGAVDDVKIT